MKRERLIQGEILDYLASRGDVFAWRNNVGGAEVKGFHMRFGTPGAADIVGVLAPTGKFLAIEVKAEKGRLRPDQERWGKQVAAAGGLYIVARSVEFVREALGPPRTNVVKPPRRVFSGATPDPEPERCSRCLLRTVRTDGVCIKCGVAS